MKSLHKVRFIMKMFLIKPLMTLSSLRYYHRLSWSAEYEQTNTNRGSCSDVRAEQKATSSLLMDSGFAHGENCRTSNTLVSSMCGEQPRQRNTGMSIQLLLLRFVYLFSGSHEKNIGFFYKDVNASPETMYICIHMQGCQSNSCRLCPRAF